MKKKHQSTKASQSTQADMDIINQILANAGKLRRWGNLTEDALFKNVCDVLKPIAGSVSCTYHTPKGGGAEILVSISNGYRINKEFLEALKAANIRVCSIQLVFQAGKASRSR
jgi:hypothetical protein